MRKKVVAVVVVVLVLVVGAVIVLNARTSQKFIQPTATFIGYTNSPRGTTVGRFRIINSSRMGISRFAQCRIESSNGEFEIVKIPRNKLSAGSSEVVEVALTSQGGLALTNARSITFGGHRNMNIAEGVAEAAENLLEKVGISSRVLKAKDDWMWQANAPIELE